MNTGNSDPPVSIVLLNYNGGRFFEFWKAIFILDYHNYEIIFVDNGSTDGSDMDFLRFAMEQPRVPFRFVKLERNVGYAKANNIGVSYAKNDFLVLLSNDILVAADWLGNAIRFLESHPNIGVAQSMMYSVANHSVPDPMGNYIDRIGFNHHLPFGNSTQKVFYCEGAVMFIRKEIISKVGGLFDEDYFMLYEDVDFCWRIRLIGYDSVVLPESIVYHQRGGTIAGTVMKTDPTYVFTNTRNRLNTLMKNYSAFNAVGFVLALTTIELLKDLWLILNGRSAAAISGIGGILAFFNGLPKLMKKRSFVQNIRTQRNDSNIVRLMIPISDSIRLILNDISRLGKEWAD